MELETLRQIWGNQDKQLDRNLRLNRFLLKEMLLGKAETRLNRLWRMLSLELIVTLLITLWIGMFMAANVAQLRFFLPAVGVQLGMIALIFGCIRQMVAIAGVDYSQPMVVIQKRLESLRVERIRITKWALLLSPLAWLPFFIILVRSLSGVDLYAIVDPTWVVANLVFGLVMIPIGYFLAKFFANQMDSYPLVGRLARDIAGDNLNAALGFIQSLEQFTNEELETPA